ncbi:hypothetical protein [Paraburkholderia sp. BL25I1N1]|uniref:hypothetical protein n=1 Tax=Paraburkholderia sp. BL25I1N1 TaxID=1938804 RepID=UPI000D07518A|nr:hypothetical protein [Paraburkholderia sp. BL25I1N1]PRY07086.1 hypothetical protein B0G73_105228 [Paraburkholderia sp. BL25I1N1]
MKLFATSDIATSVRRAHVDFTHVLVNRGYTTIKPVFFRSILIADLPVYQWGFWKTATHGQHANWRKNGGVLIDEYAFSDKSGPADVLVFVECPMTMQRIVRSSQHIAEYTVIPRPHTWRVHEQCIDLRTPAVEQLQHLWRFCRGARMTDAELAEAADLPRQHVMYMRNSLKPAEEWVMKPRLQPEFAGFQAAWEWVGAGRSASKKVVREAGHRAAVKEMARLGHIALEKYQCYPTADPDWSRLEKKRADAIADLAAVRSLVQSLPDHLQA